MRMVQSKTRLPAQSIDTEHHRVSETTTGYETGHGDSISFLKPVRRESKLTLGGVIYISVTLLLAVGAINSQNNLLFWLFGVSISIIVVSGLFSGNALMRTRVRAHSIRDAAVGDQVALSYSVQNNSKVFPLIAGVIEEFESENQVKDSFPIGRLLPASLTHVATSQIERTSGECIPFNRGMHSFREFKLSTRFPFGLLHKSLVFECHRPFMVRPYRLQLKSGVIDHQGGQGESIQKIIGSAIEGNEFWGLREYRQGDPVRRVAWKQSARYGKLVVVEKATPVSKRLWLWVRLGRTQNADDVKRFERSLALAASIIQGIRNRNQGIGVDLGLWIPEFHIRFHPNHGRRHQVRCIRAITFIDRLDVVQSDQRDNRIQHDSPPPASSNDGVVIIGSRSGTAGLGLQDWSLFDIDRPEDWLSDVNSLPGILGGDRQIISGDDGTHYDIESQHENQFWEGGRQ